MPKPRHPYRRLMRLSRLSLARLGRARLNVGHHLLLGNEMINTLEVAQQALHVGAPLVQDVICISGLREAYNTRRAIDLGVDSLGGDQLADVLLRLVLCEIQQLGEALGLDAGVVLGDHTDIVLDDSLAEIQPALVRLLIVRLTGLGVEDISFTQVRAKGLCDLWPAHELVNCEKLEKLCLLGDLADSGVLLDSVQQIVLLVVVRGKNDEVDNALEDLDIVCKQSYLS